MTATATTTTNDGHCDNEEYNLEEDINEMGLSDEDDDEDDTEDDADDKQQKKRKRWKMLD